jgi:acyl-CoA thioesterase I
MRCAVIVALAIALGGCNGPSSPSTAPLSDGAPATRSIRFLALGDSFTIGTGSSPSSAFPARLAERWRARGCSVELKNVAVNGYTTDDIIAEELPELGSYRPTFVTVAAGANDIVRGSSADEYRTRARKIVDAARASGAQVIVLPQPDWSRSPVAASFGDRETIAASIRRFNGILAAEAKAAGARYVDLSPLMEKQAADGLIATDGLHPSAAAYDAWAEALAQEVKAPCL